MKMPHQYHVSGVRSPQAQMHNEHANAGRRPTMTPTMPVFEVKRMACNYSTGKSKSSPMGKPGMGISDAC